MKDHLVFDIAEHTKTCQNMSKIYVNLIFFYFYIQIYYYDIKSAKHEAELVSDRSLLQITEKNVVSDLALGKMI